MYISHHNRIARNVIYYNKNHLKQNTLFGRIVFSENLQCPYKLTFLHKNRLLHSAINRQYICIPENDKNLSMMNNKTISESHTLQHAAIKNSGAVRSAYINFVYGWRRVTCKRFIGTYIKMFVGR